MLHHVKKLLFLTIIIISCQDKGSERNLAKLDITSKSISILQVKESVYRQVYKQAEDSLQNWAKVGLKSAMNLKVNTWKLDSLICFNKSGDKLISSVNVQLTKYSDTDHDGMYHFYGVKVKDKWYFFFGPYLVLQRLTYQKDIHNPLPFTKLHEIAMDNIFKGYLKKNKQSGQWEVNDGFFADLTSGAYGGREPKTKAQWDSVYLQVVRNNWLSRDTINK